MPLVWLSDIDIVMPPTVVETFEAHRSKLVGLAYRITGSIAEAEDIAQETFLKWMDVDHETIQSPNSWLVTVATRMSLDHLKSARIQRESYIGPWLPEPYIADNKTPQNEHELDESITMALLVLLEQLSPGERASFILHDIFHFNFDEIGEILDKTGAACRKLASRARGKIDKDAIQHNPNKQDHLEIVSAFFGAVKKGDMTELVSLLRENVILHADGGGKALAALEILEGLETVAAFLLKKVAPSFATVDSADTAITHVWFNGSPGFVIWVDAKPVSAFNFEIEDHMIKRIHALRNPDKLRFFNGHFGQVIKMA